MTLNSGVRVKIDLNSASSDDRQVALTQHFNTRANIVCRLSTIAGCATPTVWLVSNPKPMSALYRTAHAQKPISNGKLLLPLDKLT